MLGSYKLANRTCAAAVIGRESTSKLGKVSRMTNATAVASQQYCHRLRARHRSTSPYSAEAHGKYNQSTQRTSCRQLKSFPLFNSVQPRSRHLDDLLRSQPLLVRPVPSNRNDDGPHPRARFNWTSQLIPSPKGVSISPDLLSSAPVDRGSHNLYPARR